MAFMYKLSFFALLISLSFGACQESTLFVTHNGVEWDFISGLNPDKTKYIDFRDYEVYSIAKIGGMFWLTDNLRYEFEGAYLAAHSTNQKPGRVYTWDEAKKVCPKGWRLPSKRDWEHLFSSTSDANSLKSTSGWSTNGNNSTGFNAFPDPNSSDTASFWSSFSEFRIWFGSILGGSTGGSGTFYHYASITGLSYLSSTQSKNTRLPCRCIKI